ncbi:MAG: putA [Rickettsiaceae bacterium]|jgi:RHH-type proline utilization regulon transcriptional repressor/proline dehydrogenase/delta 1-pyrroline-5-carboxylate dehydrogenase|nr:putA [Rickettsiaceae bacterium]
MQKPLSALLDEVSYAINFKEEEVILLLKGIVEKSRGSRFAANQKAEAYVNHIRQTLNGVGIEAFFQQYGLDTNEGVAIMSLAEALLRIPDSDAANELIHDKLTDAKWENYNSSSTLMRASAMGLKFISKFFETENIATKLADPIVRSSIKQSMRLLGGHFVMGETIGEALKNSHDFSGYMFSYDMLGEGARSDEQAEHYLEKYLNAIEAIKETIDPSDRLYRRPGISIKLSALHPRYELANREDVLARLLPCLHEIITQAILAGISITIDAEESARLDLSLEIFSKIISDENYVGFEGIGLAVQAYHKQAHKVIDYICQLGELNNKRIPVRLVKGAYWDSEIKKAQVQGLAEYPVFTKKSYTDISYLACASKMLNNDIIYPQFATHNALTIAQIEEMAKDKELEFQLLHGMGRGVYDQVVKNYPCRIYAPVGEHEELLPYLIRRLLENSANTSFVKKIADFNIPVSQILQDPFTANEESKVPLPEDIYGIERRNSAGINLGNKATLDSLQKALEKFDDKIWQAHPIIKGHGTLGIGGSVTSPADINHKIGRVVEATNGEVKEALDVTEDAFEEWTRIGVNKRAEIIETMADLLEENSHALIWLCMNEAGRILEDSIAELREAVDLCRYYAIEARNLMVEKSFTSPTGETNILSLHGRGMFICISPWNFPLAIFLGQIVAALVTGNTVIAKPSEQTPLIATFVLKLLHKAGVPLGAVSLLPGSGEIIGKHLLNDKRIAGVVFTGSMETAKKINSELAHKEGPIVPFIAETGGQNAMIVDSSALIEQTVDDILISAFGSAGQRCSSLRVLYVQEEITDKLLRVLSGAMAELKLGNPRDFKTNIGPVIDAAARDSLRRHINQMIDKHQFIASSPIDKGATENGTFIEPHAFLINSLDDLKGEVFGPILHVIRYKYNELDKVIDEINASGYGLTLGVQSRISMRIEYIKKRANVGNVYVNRSMIGAVVGVQPFGGEGLSGTGPKAGGPHYLTRFVKERVHTVNTTAAGGNRELLIK